MKFFSDNANYTQRGLSDIKDEIADEVSKGTLSKVSLELLEIYENFYYYMNPFNNSFSEKNRGDIIQIFSKAKQKKEECRKLESPTKLDTDVLDYINKFSNHIVGQLKNDVPSQRFRLTLYTNHISSPGYIRDPKGSGKHLPPDCGPFMNKGY